MEGDGNPDPWKDFHCVGDEIDPKKKKGPWTSWIWFIVGTTLLGAALTGGFWVYMGTRMGASRSTQASLMIPPSQSMSMEEFSRRLRLYSLIGGGAGFLLGAGICVRSILFDREEKSK